ncbi:MAG: RNA methyltransferase [Muribaculaceae bacterium]|nr:RNA methyltransferase [Muribaculaceae bacterium]
MIVNITDIDDPRLRPYTSLTEAQLRNRLNPSEGLFIAESPKVIRVALNSGFQPVSMLMEERHIQGDAADIIARISPDTPIFTAERQLLADLTGYTLTRGVLAAMRRPAERPIAELVRGASRVAVLDSVVDTTNIGAIFRSAAALGIDCVLLTRRSCDPLNRRAVRVSMGTVFQVPWTWIDDPVIELRQLGFTTVAMALRNDALRLGRETDALTALPHLAIIMGTEGDGLSNRVIANADHVVMIDMAHNVDSLNVAAASALAFWQLSPR